jgi:predicted ATPase
MILRELELRNFMSLEQVKLSGLGQLNVLIGRNNVGKSAIFRAIEHLARVVQGIGLASRVGDQESSLITDGSEDPSLIYRLRFELNERERGEFIRILAEHRQGLDQPAYLASPLLRDVEYCFRSARDRATLIHLVQTKIMTTNGQDATVQKVPNLGALDTSNPASLLLAFASFARSNLPFDSDSMDLEGTRSSEYGVSQHFEFNKLGRVSKDFGLPLGWLPGLVTKFLSDCFFFAPHRRSLAQMDSEETNRLSPTGDNLARVLATVSGADRPRFASIEKFVREAVPDLGTLQTPFRSRQSEVAFIRPSGRGHIHLHEMGGGIEQLLMVATLLHTTDKACPLFLEEPESHFHPEAQRYLRDRLATDGRQVFITTHSPVFLSSPELQAVYRVQSETRRTRVTQVADAVGLGEVLEEIGVRNSDVLLADAVAFVEGDSDAAVLRAWADTLGQSLTAGRVTVLTMMGGRHADKHAPMRSELLGDISQKAPSAAPFHHRPRRAPGRRDRQTPGPTAKSVSRLSTPGTGELPALPASDSPGRAGEVRTRASDQSSARQSDRGRC